MLEMRMPYKGNIDYTEFSYSSASCWVREDGYLSSLRSEEKGKGHASALLKGVCEYADVKGKVLNLVACPSSWDNGLPRGELIKFYRRHGFKMIHCYGDEGWVYMERKPTLRLEAK